MIAPPAAATVGVNQSAAVILSAAAGYGRCLHLLMPLPRLLLQGSARAASAANPILRYVTVWSV